MDLSKWKRTGEHEWTIEPEGCMRVPGVVYATEALMRAMDDKVREQVCNVAKLPGIVKASFAMPDAHWGYGFPIGGVAAFDGGAGGVVSAGGVGFDISCGVRDLLTGLKADQVRAVQRDLADALFDAIPAGVGSTGAIHLDAQGMDDMLTGGARWAVDQGYGRPEDLARTEEQGCMEGAKTAAVSDRAVKRQQDEVGTLGSGNHYLEVQRVASVTGTEATRVFGLEPDDVVVSIHCGSRGLGHQIGTDYLRRMVLAAPSYGIELPDRELACAPVYSPLGQEYLGAMRAAMNCAMANRQVLTHLTRNVFSRFFPKAELSLLFDVSHNTCKFEEHQIGGQPRRLFVHRKGATRAFGPGHPDLPADLCTVGQPVLIGGSMGTSSYILVGTVRGAGLAWGSACHGAGRSMSRHAALRQYSGRQIQDDLARRGILVRSPTVRGIAEEAPGAYKDVSEVVEAADHAGLAAIVARVEPLITVKG